MDPNKLIELSAELEKLRAAILKFEESQAFMLRVLAAIAEDSGGEVIISPLSIAKTSLNPTIITFTDSEQRLHVKVRHGL